jgi:hypothetical protein
LLPIIPPGYQAHLVGVASSLDELNGFVPLEAGLPEPSQVLMRVDIALGEDAYSIAEDLNGQLLASGVPPWPGYPGRIAFTEGNSVYLAWLKGIAWMPIIMGLLIGLPIVLPIILWFVSPGFRETIEGMFGFLIMMLMMVFVMKLTRGITAPAKPKEELPPFAERMEARLAGVGESISKLEASVAGLESVIGETASLVTEAPRVVTTAAEKEKLAREASKAEREIERKLTQYEATLTPEQKAKLEEERRLIRELKELWRE